MLRYLGVRHLAVIDQLEVEFDRGLNILTGETGAGKSVIVEAIGLLMGGRASADLVRTGAAHATVQAVFETAGREVIVRREVSAEGRSRAFIDDTLATSAALRELGADLVELHGQREHQLLVDPTAHVDLVDAFAQHESLSAATAESFAAWRAAAAGRERAELGDREKRGRIDIASFQLQEIDKVAPRPGEDDALGIERAVLANRDKLSRLSQEAYGALYEGDAAVLSRLAVVWRRVGELATIDDRFQPFVGEREDLKARLEELARFLRQYLSSLDASPDRLQVVEDRLAALERLKRRYGPTLADAVARRDALRQELEELEATDQRLADLLERERAARVQFVDTSRKLSASRQKAAARLAGKLECDLRALAMPACRLEIRFESADEAGWSRRGTDLAEFYFSPNPGEDVRAVARIASGGELSRLMLALRIATIREASRRTLVFDEVDAGIGGETADAVGARLQALGEIHQVLCVTHLAQIAARASAHFVISKQIKAGRTLTTIEKQDWVGREGELARMIAGARVSAGVLASARELLSTRQPNEQKAKGETLQGQFRAKGRGHAV